MTPRLVIACLLSAGAVAATGAQADCRRGGVEWIVGGPVQPECDARQLPVAVRDGAAHFKVAAGQQRSRDDERLGILAQELADEERRLPQARDADSALRIRDNIAALKREIARLSGTPR
jgi:hypothetical protein